MKAQLIGTVAACLAAAAFAAAASAGEGTRSKQYECERVDFRVADRPAFVILPKEKSADGTRPWLWFAPVLRDRWPDRWHDWLFSRLLQNGFAVAGIDIDESWGNPEGRALFTKFYEHMVQKVSDKGEFELSPKPCFLAQTRGMLMVLNWAAEHPKCVGSIGAIYPLCHITNSPFFSRMYKLGEDPNDEKQNEAALDAKFAEHNPMDRLAPLAAEKVPFFMLHGGEDHLVPASTNSAELVVRYAKLGGHASLVIRRTGRHEPSIDFFESDELLKFYLSQVKAPEKKAGTEGGGAVPPATPVGKEKTGTEKP